MTKRRDNLVFVGRALRLPGIGAGASGALALRWPIERLEIIIFKNPGLRSLFEFLRNRFGAAACKLRQRLRPAHATSAMNRS